jgi:transposase InsO family protein
MTSFHSDNGSGFLNWPLHAYLTGRPLKVPWTRSRAYRKNDNAHCEQKNWPHARQLLGYERFGHPELVPLLN